LIEGRIRWIRKTYGPDQIHYLRCQSEFGERKNTPFWKPDRISRLAGWCRPLRATNSLPTGQRIHSAAVRLSAGGALIGLEHTLGSCSEWECGARGWSGGR